MTKVLVTEDYLEGIADGIRYANGGSATYKPPQMENAIKALKKTLVEKNITVNGSYDPADDSADGYSAVTVNVPNSYAAGDEGKVVSNGALVAQTARASQINANGTYDTTTNNSVTVNVSGGGGSVSKVEMTSCPQQCYLYSGGDRGWAVYPETPGAQNAETFYADIPAAYQNGGVIILSTEKPSGATYQFTRNRLGFTDGTEDPTNLPDGQGVSRTTQPSYYMNAMSAGGDKQFTIVKVPSDMTRVYWTTTQASYRVAGQKSYMWLIGDADFSAAIGIDWRYYIPDSFASASEVVTEAWPL